MALYRRFRPEAFNEVIGQEHVTVPLMAALRAGRVNHAYLFSGPRGCGKTTSARILARTINCARNTDANPLDTPCGECPSCVELSRLGTGSVDVVEIDAASHGGVDAARDLRERATFTPTRDRFKIFIIDEAHMVTKEGFNALLKVVEEPPPHIKFIFATTEPDKVLATIRSRTHHYPFRLVPPDTLGPYLAQICANEGVAVAPEVVPLVIRAGAGSVRDSLSVLDQLIAAAPGGQIDYAHAASLLGFTPAEVLNGAVAALGVRDGAALFRVVDSVIDAGTPPHRFVEDLLERIRDLIVITVSGSDPQAVLPDMPAGELAEASGQARLFTLAQLTALGELISAGLNSMSGATAPRLQLELLGARLLVEAGLGGASSTLAPPPAAPAVSAMPDRAVGRPATGVQRVAPVSPTTTAPPPTTPPAPPATMAPSPSPAPLPVAPAGIPVPAPALAVKPVEPIAPEPKAPEPAPVVVLEPELVAAPEPASVVMAESTPVVAEPTPAVVAESAPVAAPAPAVADELSRLTADWPEVVARVQSPITNPLLAASLGPISVEPALVRIGFVQPALAERLNQPRSRQHFLPVLNEYLGREVQVEGVVAPAPPAAPGNAAYPPARAPGAVSPNAAASAMPSKNAEAAANDPWDEVDAAWLAGEDDFPAAPPPSTPVPSRPAPPPSSQPVTPAAAPAPRAAAPAVGRAVVGAQADEVSPDDQLVDPNTIGGLPLVLEMMGGRVINEETV